MRSGPISIRGGRRGQQIGSPARMGRVPEIRSCHGEVQSIAHVQQRGGARLSRLGAGCAQQQYRQSIQARGDAAGSTRGSGSGQAAGPPGGRRPRRAGLVRAHAAGPSAVYGAAAARKPQPVPTGPPCPRLDDHPYPPAIPAGHPAHAEANAGPGAQLVPPRPDPWHQQPRQGLATAHRANRRFQLTPTPVAQTARLPGY